MFTQQAGFSRSSLPTANGLFICSSSAVHDMSHC
jgi:hypothetical protein